MRLSTGGGDIAGKAVSARLGRQVVSWGESLFIQGGIASAQAPLDATKASIPGVELKEIFLPVGQLYVQADLSDSLSVEGYHQYEWAATRLDAAGSYFSTSDYLDEGGESLILAPGFAATRGSDADASDSGQWGVALRYLADERLNHTEFGLYYANYHDKLPQLNLDMATASYNLSYMEDIHLLGASFGTVIGNTNVSGEISYRENAPVMAVDATALLGFKMQRAEVLQTQVSAVHLFGENALMDDLSLTFEAGVNKVLDMKGDELVNDRSAWGYSATITPKYFVLFPGVDLDLPISFSQGVNGISSALGTFTEDKNKLGINARFTYLSDYQLQVGYTNFLGSSSENNQADRDFISLSLKTTF
ncbi:DUF1302 family protein [Pseudomonas fluorescens]|nr:DUF1302 family protein [Pseudomonas fluorescens]